MSRKNEQKKPALTRLLALVLTFIMIVGAVPVAVFAALATPEESYEAPDAEAIKAALGNDGTLIYYNDFESTTGTKDFNTGAIGSNASLGIEQRVGNSSLVTDGGSKVLNYSSYYDSTAKAYKTSVNIYASSKGDNTPVSANSGKSFVWSADIKLGDKIAPGYLVSFFNTLVQGATGVYVTPVYIHTDGSLFYGGGDIVNADQYDASRVFATLSKKEYTNIAIHVNVENNTFSVYINGNQVLSGCKFLSDEDAATIASYPEFANGFAISQIGYYREGEADNFNGSLLFLDKVTFYTGSAFISGKNTEPEQKEASTSTSFVPHTLEELKATVGLSNIAYFNDYNSLSVGKHSNGVLNSAATKLSNVFGYENNWGLSIIADEDNNKAMLISNTSNIGGSCYVTPSTRKAYPANQGKNFVYSVDYRLEGPIKAYSFVCFSSWRGLNSNYSSGDNAIYTAIPLWVDAKGNVYATNDKWTLDDVKTAHGTGNANYTKKISGGIVWPQNSWKFDGDINGKTAGIIDKSVGNDGVIAKLSKTEYTNITVQVKGNKWMVYVNGIKAFDEWKLFMSDSAATSYYANHNGGYVAGNGFAVTHFSNVYADKTTIETTTQNLVVDNTTFYWGDTFFNEVKAIDNEILKGNFDSSLTASNFNSAPYDSVLLHYNDFNDQSIGVSPQTFASTLALGNNLSASIRNGAGEAIIDDGRGGKALTYKAAASIPSGFQAYYQLNGVNNGTVATVNSGKSFVISTDIKLTRYSEGSIFGATAYEAYAEGYDRDFNAEIIYTKPDGGIYIAHKTEGDESGVYINESTGLWKNTAKKIGQLSKTEFTNIAIAVNVEANTYKVYINGVDATGDMQFLLSSDKAKLEATTAYANGFGLSYSKINFLGGNSTTVDAPIILDNIAAYLANAPVKGYSGFVKEASGKYVLYENGEKAVLTEKLELDGVLSVDTDAVLKYGQFAVYNLSDYYYYINEDLIPKNGLYSGIYTANSLISASENKYYYNAKKNLVLGKLYEIGDDDSSTTEAKTGLNLNIPGQISYLDGMVQFNGGMRYYENGVLKTGFFTANSKNYYADTKGYLQTGVKYVNNAIYFFNTSTYAGTLKTVGNYAFANNANGALYTTLEEAMSAVSDGGRIVLIKDFTVTNIVPNKNIEIDLNGHTLTADGAMMAFGSIVDSSENNTGRLNVPENKYSAEREITDNIMVYDPELGAYSFYTVHDQKQITTSANKLTLVFRPSLNNDIETNRRVFGTLKADNKLEIRVDVKFTTEEGTIETREFKFSNSLINDAYTNDKALKLTCTFNKPFTDIEVKYYLTSTGTGVNCTLGSKNDFVPEFDLTEDDAITATVVGAEKKDILLLNDPSWDITCGYGRLARYDSNNNPQYSWDYGTGATTLNYPAKVDTNPTFTTMTDQNGVTRDAIMVTLKKVTEAAPNSINTSFVQPYKITLNNNQTDLGAQPYAGYHYYKFSIYSEKASDAYIRINFNTTFTDSNGATNHNGAQNLSNIDIPLNFEGWKDVTLKFDGVTVYYPLPVFNGLEIKQMSGTTPEEGLKFGISDIRIEKDIFEYSIPEGIDVNDPAIYDSILQNFKSYSIGDESCYDLASYKAKITDVNDKGLAAWNKFKDTKQEYTMTTDATGAPVGNGNGLMGIELRLPSNGYPNGGGWRQWDEDGIQGLYAAIYPMVNAYAFDNRGTTQIYSYDPAKASEAETTTLNDYLNKGLIKYNEATSQYEYVSFYKNEALLEDIMWALEYCYDNFYGEYIIRNGIIGNWFGWRIGIPQQLVPMLTLLKLTPKADGSASISEADIYKYLQPIYNTDKSPVETNHAGLLEFPNGAGSNLANMTQVCILTGALIKDYKYIANAQFYMNRDCYTTFTIEQMGLGSDGGFFADGSYIQHSVTPYHGSYGLGIIGNFPKLTYFVENTAFQTPTKYTRKHIDYILDSFKHVIYEGMLFSTTNGRACITGGEAYNYNTVRKAMLEMLAYVPEYRKEEFLTYVKTQMYIAGSSCSGTVGMVFQKYAEALYNDDSIGILTNDFYTKVYGNMCRTVQHNDGYAVVISISSQRIHKYESINSANETGWYHSDGMLYIYNGKSGYSTDYYWYANPYLMPGTTANASFRVRTTLHPQNPNKYNFAGGVQQGLLGMNGFKLGYDVNNATTNISFNKDAKNKATIEANKSYFMFNDEIVCIGSGIKDASGERVRTVVDNKAWDSSDILSINGTPVASVFTKDMNYNNISGATASEHYVNASNALRADYHQTLTGVNYMHFTGMGGYVFLDGALGNTLKYSKTKITSHTTYGTIADENRTGNNAGSRTYLELLLDHGTSTSGLNTTYEYVLLPTATNAQTAAYYADPDVQILSKTENLHAVVERDTHALGATFFEAGELTLDEAITPVKRVKSTTGACVMISTNALGQTVISVSEPTQELNSITFEIDVEDASSIISTDSGVVARMINGTVYVTVDTTKAYGATFSLTVK